MKLNWTEDTTTNVISGSVIAAVAVSFYFILKNISVIFNSIGTFFDILSPFITGFVIAYLLARPMNMFEGFFKKHIFKKSKNKDSLSRGLSIAVTFILLLAFLAFIVYLIVPQLIDSVTTLAKNADGYVRSANAILDKMFDHFNIDPLIFDDILGSSQDMFKDITQYVATKLPQIFDFSVSIGSGIYNFFIGFIISIYMLSSKNRFGAQLKKILFAVLPEKVVSETISTFTYMDDTFGKYFSGQILDSFILGIICFILMSIFGMEYALLISMIITLTNFIPFVGPIIGAVPSAFILLMVQPRMTLWFILMIIVLQQLDGNLLAPKIVGKTTGLSSFWVIFSILVGGDLFGVAGIVLAVPTFSVAYTFLKRFVESQLRKKGKPTETSEYY